MAGDGSRRRFRVLVGIAALVGAAVSGPTSAQAAQGATVSGPITGGQGAPSVSTTSFDLKDVGYEQSEFLLSGTANAYSPAAPLTNDGRWTVTPGDPQSYTTRIVVYRPVAAKKFNGTVLVEWLNVSGGVDAGPDWVMTHTELVREGFAWVGVSAQAVGVEASKTADPVRYASLSHPGDSYSYDVYSQAGRAIRSNAATVLGGLKPRRLIAAGESQSAARMVTYIDALQKRDHVFDAFLVHSRAAGGAPLRNAPTATSGASSGTIAVPVPTAVRDDISAPVLVLQTETDVYNSNVTARQPDTRRYRLWEVAGTSHYDAYGLFIGPKDTGNGQGASQLLASMRAPTNNPVPGAITCDLAINTGPAHWVLDAAVYALNRWVTKGAAPAVAPRLVTDAIAPVVYALDDTGNARGGIRTPQVDVPIAALGGTTNTGKPPLGTFCRLFGTTVPLTTQQLQALYPTHDAFVTKWKQELALAVKAGFVLPADARELQQAAESTTIPS